jgi:rubrerythrin
MADAALIIFITLFFVFGLPMIFMIIYFLKVHKPIEQTKASAPREVVVKEVVMVPCQYCGGLMREAETQCPHCKAPRKILAR